MSKSEQKLYRLPNEAVIAGVASGFARYFRLDVTLMRLIFVGALLISSGTAFVVYIILAIIMPIPNDTSAKNLGEKIENLAEEVRSDDRAQTLSAYIGAGLILIGAWLLAGQFFPDLARIQWSMLWPSLVIIIGVLIITRSKKRG